LATLEQKIASMPAQPTEKSLGPTDTLLVPAIAWRIVHDFSELEGKRFQNPKLSDLRLDQAMQTIQFRLDRGGMELRSEAKFAALCVPSHYRVNRPFLLYAKKRGAERPYFVMWVDNAELLAKAVTGAPAATAPVAR
jgi:hypothetical protein